MIFIIIIIIIITEHQKTGTDYIERLFKIIFCV